MEPFAPQITHSLHWYDENSHGRMRMNGADSLPLLHRLTTNHMLELKPGRSCQSVLTTPIGRSMDLLTVLNDESAVWVFTSASQGPMVYTHLKKNIFFNDKVVLTIHRLPAPELNSIGEQFIESGRINSVHFLILKIVSRVQLTYNEHAAVLNKQIEEFERKLFLKSSSKISIETLYVLKRKAGISKKLLLLTEEVITSLLHRHKKSNEIQDIRDNHKKLILFYDQLNEDAQNLLSTYMSYNGQKTNEVMKVLTLFSAYFLPLTFIVGVYGMNFKYMPELSWEYGYPITIGLMLLVFIFIYLWFRKRKWL